MPGKQCPCRDCTDRMLLCHGRCDKYQSWKAEYESTKEANREFIPEFPKEMKRHIWRMMKGGRRR